MTPDPNNNKPLDFISPLGRWPYFWWGCGLMAVKYNLDRAIAWYGFHRPWYFWNYIKPHGISSIDALPPTDDNFYLILLLTALPFVAVGIYLTLRRLRSAELPLAWCLLFFVPVLNLTFFVFLCLFPEAKNVPKQSTRTGPAFWLPLSAAGSALAGMVIVGTVGGCLAWLSTELLRGYGWGLFVALPFAMGLVSVLIFCSSEPRSLLSCLFVAILPVIFAGAFLIVMAVEGAVCLIMAAPIGLVLALLGGLVGYLIAGKRGAPLPPSAMLLILASVPMTMGMERAADEAPPMLSVTSSLVINAPPERVWPNVVAFTPIPPERDWVLHTGIAYPTSARIDGFGPGAVRHCIFTTGEFVEPIEVWDENHLLRFSVSAQPEPMEEMSPYPHIKTPHLDGYFQTHQGELRLTALPGDKTLLQGTTWYTDRIWPEPYWQIWSDFIIHRIHMRVMQHIKNLSEHPASSLTLNHPPL